MCERGPEQNFGNVLGLLDAAWWVRSSSEENISGGGDFSLGGNMGSDSVPQKLSDESINRGLVCEHMHSIAQIQKILTFMS